MSVVRYEEAAAALQRAVKLKPEHAAIRAQLADILRNHGQIAEAERIYREIVREQPWAGAAWRGLADLKTTRLYASDVADMRAALASPKASHDDRVAIGFALAKALEDIGDYEGSLRALAQAKGCLHQRQTWSAKNFSQNVTAILNAFKPPPIDTAMEELGHEVIFIVGMPRSGTTLAEQILASHCEVEGAGELVDMMSVVTEESHRRNKPFPEWVPTTRSAGWERLGRRYLERTAAWRRRRRIFTDKLPNNWVFVGAILAMLPSAHVVCCRRDPLETCFSNYRQYRRRLEYTGAFTDLASFWHDYDRSVRSWRARYPDQVYEHGYEVLLDDPEASVGRLLEFCGLPWDPRCLRFHENRRDVHTPSATQIREPLRRDTARSQRYGSLLYPLRSALGLPPFVDQARDGRDERLATYLHDTGGARNE